MRRLALAHHNAVCARRRCASCRRDQARQPHTAQRAAGRARQRDQARHRPRARGARQQARRRAGTLLPGRREVQSRGSNQRRLQADRRHQGRFRDRARRLQHAHSGVQVVRRCQHHAGRRARGPAAVRRQGMPSERLLHLLHQRRLACRCRPVHDQQGLQESVLPRGRLSGRKRAHRGRHQDLQGSGDRAGLHAAHAARLCDRNRPHPRREAGRGVLVPGRRRRHRLLQAIRASRADESESRSLRKTRWPIR